MPDSTSLTLHAAPSLGLDGAKQTPLSPNRAAALAWQRPRKRHCVRYRSALWVKNFPTASETITASMPARATKNYWTSASWDWRNTSLVFLSIVHASISPQNVASSLAADACRRASSEKRALFNGVTPQASAKRSWSTVLPSWRYSTTTDEVSMTDQLAKKTT